MKHTDDQRGLEITEVASRARRRLLGAGGGVLGVSTLVPAAWVKPIVNAVMLPAHATHSPGHADSSVLPPLPVSGPAAPPAPPFTGEREARAGPVLDAVAITVDGTTSVTQLVVTWRPPLGSEAAANVDRYGIRYKLVIPGLLYTAEELIESSAAEADGSFEWSVTLPDAMAGELYGIRLRAIYDVSEAGEPASHPFDGAYITSGEDTVPGG